MKYIDAEKLKEKIEKKYLDAKEKASFARETGTSSDCTKWYAIVLQYENVLRIITSLQQERSFPRWIHANYSDKPEIRYTPSGTPYLQNGSYMIWLSDLDTLPKDGTDLTNPIQEQPEVELEKAARYVYESWMGGTMDDVRWDMVELGKVLNARKEE